MTRSARLKGDRLFYAVNNAILISAFVAVLYPLIYIVSASFSDPNAVSSGRVWLYPVEFTLRGYQSVLSEPSVLSGYLNSLIYMSVGTVINVVVTVLAAYPLSRPDFKSAGPFMFLFTFTMLFHGGLVPTYLVVNSLGLVNTRLALWLPSAMAIYNMIITRTFFQSTIPSELLDSAQIDGCGDLRFFVAVVLPLSKAVIAVNALLYGVFHWNRFFEAFIYLQDKDLHPLQLVLRRILILNQLDGSMMDSIDIELMEKRQGLAELLKFSLIIVASVPMLIIYPFAQRYFVKGVMIGSIKG